MTFDFASNEKLLGIEEICEKLSISRTTLERLRSKHRLQLTTGITNNEYAGMSPFPEPTIVLGRSPRWSVSVLNEWIESGNNCVKSLLNR